jgi:predicted  nucleic acid-binding Zn-ribbon protein
MSVLFDWKIRDIENTSNEAKRRLHELDTLRSDVDRMEHTLWETRAEADGLRNELQAWQERMTRLEAALEEMANDSFIAINPKP